MNNLKCRGEKSDILVQTQEQDAWVDLDICVGHS